MIGGFKKQLVLETFNRLLLHKICCFKIEVFSLPLKKEYCQPSNQALK